MAIISLAVTTGCTGGLGAPSATTSTPRDYASDWQEVATSPLSPRVGSSAVWTGEEVLVFGGNDDPPCSDLCFDEQHTDAAAYNPTTDEWRAISNVPRGPHGFGFQGGIYADGHVFSSSFDSERTLIDYDVTTDSWGTLDIPVVRSALMTPIGDRLLVLSACLCPRQPVTTLAVDIHTGEQETLPDDPFPRTARRQIATVDGNIYVFASPAGAGELRGVVLRPGAERWARLPSLPGEKVEVYPDSLYPIVLDDGIVVADTESVFDTGTETWAPMSDELQQSLPHEYDYPETPLNATTAWLGDRWFAFGGHVHGGLTNRAYVWAPVD
jgi:hypothetical protein